MEEDDTQQEPASGAPNIEPVAAGNPCNIVKGKRTKRQRPHSPIPFMITTAIPITNTAKSEEASSDICSNVQDAVTVANTATSSDEDHHWCSTEEEEDMANCLILLAQGQAREVINESPKQQPVNEKYTSRKYMENPNGSKTGYYVYECRTCFKTFPSFQALGGHRASHKRPKKDEDTNRSNNLFLLPDDDNNINYHAPFRTNPIANPNPYNNNLPSSSLSLQLTNRSFYETDGNHNKKSRVHECSICGAEFSSGQALGGHMRRHRGPVGSVGGANGGFHHGHGYNHGHHHGMQQSSPVLSFTRLVMDGDNNGDHQSSMEASKLNLDLDLNLPAPSEEESKIQLELKNLQHEEQQQRESSLPPPPATQQQEKLVLSPPSLVDCHY